MGIRVDRYTNPYQAVEQHQRKAQQTIQQQDRLTISLVFRAQLPLHLTLITAVIRDVEKKAADQHWPEGEVVAITQTMMTKIKRRQPVCRDTTQHGIEATSIPC